MQDVVPSPTDKLAWHEERLELPLPPAEVYARLDGAALESLLPGTRRLPGVVATEPLNDIAFPAPGARRRVRLADGNSAVEQVLENRPNAYFAYQVWAYTSPEARPVHYAKGEFWYLPAAAGCTLRWRYSFHLRGNRFPGLLGPVGRALFTRVFLDRTYAEFMRSCLAAIEGYVLASGAGLSD